MPKKQVELIYPTHLVKEPLIYQMAKTLDVVPKAETHKLEGPMCMFL